MFVVSLRHFVYYTYYDIYLYFFIRHLRTGYGGLLRMNPAFSEFGLKDLLPLRLKNPDEGCTRVNRSQYCFDAGTVELFRLFKILKLF